jgi:hypothetical protein
MQFVRPFTGDQREVTRFVLFPMKINGTIYWLEKIRIHQSYNTRSFGWCNDWIVD